MKNYLVKPLKIIDTGANSIDQAIGEGQIAIILTVQVNTSKCVIKNGNHVPALCYRLLYVSSMEKQGIKTEFDNINSKLSSKRDGSLLDM